MRLVFIPYPNVTPRLLLSITHLTCNGIQMAVYSNLELGHSLFCKLAHHKGHLSTRVDISYRHCRRKCNDSIHFASLVPRKPMLEKLSIRHL